VKAGRDELDWAPDLDGPERDQVDGWSGLSAAERADVERRNLEVCGLLPWALDPVEPSPRLAAAILERAAGSKAAAFPSAPRRPRSWLLPLAAALAVVAIGVAANLARTARQQRLELAALASRVEELARDAVEFEDGLARALQNLRLVSSRGVEICPLRPVADAAGTDEPHGLLFVAADHQHWYVRVSGLPTAPDRFYRLWFEGPDGTLIPAGNLAGDELELSSPTMPEGTRAAYVTLETEPSPAAPSGEIVLSGAEMIRLL